MNRAHRVLLTLCLFPAGCASEDLASIAQPALGDGTIVYQQGVSVSADIKTRSPSGVISSPAGMNSTKEDAHPRYSPDGDSIVFSSRRQNSGESCNPCDFEIYVWNAGTVTRLTQNDHDDLTPAYSPDGNTIVFASTRDGGQRLFLMGAAGELGGNPAAAPLTTGSAPIVDSSPIYSPDGTKIAFARQNPPGGTPINTTHILEIDAEDPENDGRAVRDLTILSGPATAPDFAGSYSPDGTQLVVSRGFASTLTKIDLSTFGATALAVNGAARPAWSPDGSAIVYSAQTWTGLRLFRIPAGGGTATMLTFGYDLAPAWR